MATVTISLSAAQAKYVSGQVKSRRLKSAGEYISQLILTEQLKAKRGAIDRLLLEGLQAPYSEFTEQDLRDIEREGLEKLAEEKTNGRETPKSSSARKDLLEHFMFIARSNQAAASAFCGRRQGDDGADHMPELASLWESDDPRLADVHIWPIRQFENYLIFYRIRSDGIRIIRVLHAAQDIDRALGSS